MITQPNRNTTMNADQKKPYPTNNRGALWANRTPPQHREEWEAHYNGTIIVDGKEYWLNMYNVESDNARAPDYKVYVKPKEEPKPEPVAAKPEDVPNSTAAATFERLQKHPSQPALDNGMDNFDDDIPF